MRASSFPIALGALALGVQGVAAWGVAGGYSREQRPWGNERPRLTASAVSPQGHQIVATIAQGA